MWVYKDGILPGMWSWLTRTESGMVETPENWEANSSQLAALLVHTAWYLLEWNIWLSENRDLKQQLLSAKVTNFLWFCSQYLKAVVDNDSEKIAFYSKETARTQYDIMQLNLPEAFEGTFIDIAWKIHNAIQDARTEERLR